VIVGDPGARARAELEFANGLELGGGPLVEYARRHRVLAFDVLELVDLHASEQSGRFALQGRIGALDKIVARLHGEVDGLRARTDAELGTEPEL
jgi:hypothetical protein